MRRSNAAEPSSSVEQRSFTPVDDVCRAADGVSDAGVSQSDNDNHEFTNDRPDSNGRTAIDEPDTEACLLPSTHGRDGRMVLEAAYHSPPPLPPLRALCALLA